MFKKKVKKEAATTKPVKKHEFTLKDLDPIKLQMGYVGFKKIQVPTNIKNWFNSAFQPDRRYLILMRLRNKDRRQMLVFSKDGTFTYDGGRYLIDDNCAEYDMTAKCYVLEYHQDLSIPIKFSINIAEMKQAASDPRVSDIDAALNPYSLQKYGVSTVVEGMMQGAGLDQRLDKIVMWIMACAVGVYAHFLLYLFKSGVLQSVTSTVTGVI